MVVVLVAVAPEHALGVGERRKVMLRETSRRTLALKDSIVALSVGFPGR
jgi:hypothetical protein